MLAVMCRDRVTSYPCCTCRGALSGRGAVDKPGSDKPAILDVAPLLIAVVEDIQRGEPAARIARRFHLSIAAMLAEACVEARQQTGVNVVALSGGVFQNRLLLEQLMTNLKRLV
jgi:hydrogenase maturation protein HypF